MPVVKIKIWEELRAYIAYRANLPRLTDTEGCAIFHVIPARILSILLWAALFPSNYEANSVVKLLMEYPGNLPH